MAKRHPDRDRPYFLIQDSTLLKIIFFQQDTSTILIVVKRCSDFR